jgi:hypothetical protein
VTSIPKSKPSRPSPARSATSFAKTMPLEGKQQIFEALLAYFSTPTAKFPINLSSIGAAEAKFQINKILINYQHRWIRKPGYKITFRLAVNTRKNPLLDFYYVDLGKGTVLIRMKYDKWDTGTIKLTRPFFKDRMIMLRRIYSHLKAIRKHVGKSRRRTFTLP